jgi:hypothetical protein
MLQVCNARCRWKDERPRVRTGLQEFKGLAAGTHPAAQDPRGAQPPAQPATPPPVCRAAGEALATPRTAPDPRGYAQGGSHS